MTDDPPTVAWVTEPSGDGVDTQARTLAAHADEITLVMAAETRMARPAAFDAHGVCWPGGEMGLVETLHEIDADVVVCHTLNALVRRALPSVVPFAPVAIRLGLNLRAAILAGLARRVPEYLRCLHLADAIVSSGTHATRTVEAVGVDAPVYEIPSAVDASAAADPSAHANETIGTVGSIKAEKNQWLTVEVAAAVRELEWDVQPDVLLAGEPQDPLLSALREAVEPLGLVGRVHHFGYVPNPVENFYPRLGVHLLPSWTENCPLTVLEAAQAGVPTVAADMAWAEDFPGLVTRPLDDPMAWAAAVRDLLTDPGHRTETVRRQQAGLERFDVGGVLDDYRAAFRELVDGPGTAKIDPGAVA